jgi:hypothetical protein
VGQASVRTSAEGASARSVGEQASALTSAEEADAKSAGGRASARTSDKGADARSVARRASASTRSYGANARSARRLSDPRPSLRLRRTEVERQRSSDVSSFRVKRPYRHMYRRMRSQDHPLSLDREPVRDGGEG